MTGEASAKYATVKKGDPEADRCVRLTYPQNRDPNRSGISPLG